MKKCVSYSLFGFDKERQDGCFDFSSYLRGLMVNLRMNRLLFPDFQTVLHIDEASYNAYMPLFTSLGESVRCVICEPAPLCKAMLWRLKPLFEKDAEGFQKYTHVLCRDLDSPATYREVQAVTYWLNRDKACHAITDSVSHDVPLMGGMIGFKTSYFLNHVIDNWEDFVTKTGINYEKKGSDQDFLNRVVYPMFASKGSESIIQHYFLGMANTFLDGYLTCQCPQTVGHASTCHNNIEVSIPYNLIESNGCCGHIGAAGFYPAYTFNFLRKHAGQFDDILRAERLYPDLFYWTKDKTFD